MPLATVTSTTLLGRLGDPADEAAWAEYVERYRPLIVAFLRRGGLPEADAEDVAQETLGSFTEAYRAGRYDRARGRLRSWLFGMVKNHLRAHRRRAPREVQPRERTGETGVLDRAPDPTDDLERAWEEEWRAAVVRRALDEVALEVEPATMRAFERFALRERPAGEVAAELGLSPNAVYGAKRRVLRRLRELLPLIEDAF